MKSKSNKLESARKRRIAAIGTFDGVHRGHHAVLQTLAEHGKRENLLPVAVTFHPHPLAVVDPERVPPLLCSIEMREKLLLAEGVEPLMMEFNEQMRRLSAREWLRHLHMVHGVERVVVGYDNTFGSDGRQLSPEDYVALGAAEGIPVVVAPVVEGISSSKIRKAVAEGDVAHAAKMLGRPFEIEGVVEHGNHIGTKLGFPTANLAKTAGTIQPPPGVYAAFALLDDGSKLPAMVNTGYRPTVTQGDKQTIEAHIPGWEGDLYGRSLGLQLIEFLRPEIRFSNPGELKRQIESDRIKTLEILKNSIWR